jgi:hypothetical protein
MRRDCSRWPCERSIAVLSSRTDGIGMLPALARRAAQRNRMR